VEQVWVSVRVARARDWIMSRTRPRDIKNTSISSFVTLSFTNRWRFKFVDSMQLAVIVLASDRNTEAKNFRSVTFNFWFKKLPTENEVFLLCIKKTASMKIRIRMNVRNSRRMKKVKLEKKVERKKKGRDNLCKNTCNTWKSRIGSFGNGQRDMIAVKGKNRGSRAKNGNSV
jgi:hypothetical protein